MIPSKIHLPHFVGIITIVPPPLNHCRQQQQQQGATGSNAAAGGTAPAAAGASQQQQQQQPRVRIQLPSFKQVRLSCEACCHTTHDAAAVVAG
jgi:cobalamin biosynthesis protein CbiD